MEKKEGIIRRKMKSKGEMTERKKKSRLVAVQKKKKKKEEEEEDAPRTLVSHRLLRGE